MRPEAPIDYIPGMQRFLIVMAAVPLLLATAAPAAGEKADGSGKDSVRIGVVDFARARDLSRRGQLARERLLEHVRSAERKTRALHEELSRLEAGFRASQASLGPEALEEERMRFAARVKELRREAEDIKYELQRFEQRLVEQILGELEQVTALYGKHAGYDVILEVGALPPPYVSEAIDITVEVVKFYDAQPLKQSSEKDTEKP